MKHLLKIQKCFGALTERNGCLITSVFINWTPLYLKLGEDVRLDYLFSTSKLWCFSNLIYFFLNPFLSCTPVHTGHIFYAWHNNKTLQLLLTLAVVNANSTYEKLSASASRQHMWGCACVRVWVSEFIEAAWGHAVTSFSSSSEHSHIVGVR